MTEKGISISGAFDVTASRNGLVVGHTQIGSGVFKVGYEKLVDGFNPTLVVGSDMSPFDSTGTGVNTPLSFELDISRTDTPCTAVVNGYSIAITGSSEFTFTIPEDCFIGEFALDGFSRANLTDSWFVPAGTAMTITYRFTLNLSAPTSVITIRDIDYFVDTTVTVPDYTNYQWYHFIRTQDAYMRSTGADYLRPVSEVRLVQDFSKIKNDNGTLLSLDSKQSINPIAHAVNGDVVQNPILNLVIGNGAWEVTYTFQDTGEGLPVLASNERIGIRELYKVLTEEIR